jgi:MinD-like ATPase involved in chromosome partitioning or flagellar assembly/predicted acylesterase/phospholipase RssA
VKRLATPSAASESTTRKGAGRGGKIITFYSYKGGTGRSMMLANVAWLLASQGKNVLVIDWDLEAPGLHRYFSPFIEDKELSFSDGLINFVDDFRTKAMSPPPPGETPASRWYAEYADISQYAVALGWEGFDSAGGRLDFVPAGRQDEDYSTLVNAFVWKNFYEELGGSLFLEEAARLMRRDYDYVLIDSRTGVSDTSGICTVKMPDALVVCFTLNNQSINGAAAVADYVFARRGGRAAEGGQVAAPTVPAPQWSSGQDAGGHGANRPFNVFPVMMRLDDTLSRKLERRLSYAKERFRNYPVSFYEGGHSEYWEQVRVRYYAGYSYEEVLAAFWESERNVNSLQSSVERLTAYITEGNVVGQLKLPQPRRDEYLIQFEGDAYEAAAMEESPRNIAEDALASVPPDSRDMARRIILRLVRVAGVNEAEHTRRVIPLRGFTEPAQKIVQLLRNFQLLVVRWDESVGGEVVQISPDVSLNDWKQLNDWIEADRSFLLWVSKLREKAALWQQSARQNRADDISEYGLLLPPSELSYARQFLQNRAEDISSDEMEFIQASLMRQEIEQQERERQERERRREEDIKRLEERRKREQQGERSRDPLSNLLDRFKSAESNKSRGLTANATISAAREILRGRTTRPLEVLTLARRLKEDMQFGYARRLLERLRVGAVLYDDPRLRLQVHHQLALCTYKDPDLAIDLRLDRALEILREVEDIGETRNQETLGLIGAIYKRKWEVDNQRSNLERSLFYYLRGYKEGVEYDQGYTSINAAYLLDLLAHQEEEEAERAKVPADAIERERIDQRRKQAAGIRANIVEKVAPLIEQSGTDWLQGKWWFYSTVAEALFGLGGRSNEEHYDTALAYLERGREMAEPLEWEFESTVRQLASLARLQSRAGASAEDVEGTAAWQMLAKFLGRTAPVRSAFYGKIGLGLSGGGFRASLFHIGVLAKLAELDVLRHVEVISCVSGGSIIGAHYYLEVRQLLQEKADEEITREDYIELVRRMGHDFLMGVQSNIRTLVTAEAITNLALAFRPSYSRTQRVGELFEREIYSRVRDGGGNKPRFINELFVRPKGEPDDFRPKYHNWRRESKVPILILNATTLNTGHSWHFTASYMGEPPAGIDSEIDGNDRLRRMYYDEAPDEWRHVRLGHAVAASACVPGLFEPLIMDNLYPDRRVRLVDGGVCDNQGVGGLLEQDCNVLLISDGSGQMESQKDPSGGLLGVPLRSSTILQARVRQSQFRDLASRRRSRLLRGFMFVHLKEDLDVDPVDWIGCLDPYDDLDSARTASRRGPLTRYGISKDIQQLLSSVRTDLDSFSDVESYALMTSGYRMTEYAFADGKCVEGFDTPPEPVDWEFLTVEGGMKGVGRKYLYVRRLLSVSDMLAFKIWKLSMPLRAAALVMSTALLLVGVSAVWQFRDSVLVKAITVGALTMLLVSMGLTALGTALVGKQIMRIRRLREVLIRAGVGILMAVFGFVLSRLHLAIFDKMYLRLGSIERYIRQR